MYISSEVIILLGKEFVVLSRIRRTLGGAVDIVYNCPCLVVWMD